MNAGLRALGYDPFFADQIQASEQSLLPARVAFESRGIYLAVLADGATLNAELRGALRQGPRRGADDFPVVGDWILLQPHGEKRAMIRRVLTRRNALVRREQSRREAGRRAATHQILAANVDWGLITTSLNEDWNPRRLERYLGLVRDSGAAPAILLTKTDLAADGGAQARAVAQTLDANVPVLSICAPTGQGLEALTRLLDGKGTAVLIGSSGVGKSTLVNALLGEDRMATAAIRGRDGHGRHTTAGRHLITLPQGGCLIDSPGLRDVGLTRPASADFSFEDLPRLVARCRFSDCGHSNEPGCAVRQALEQGELDPERWTAYMKLREESAQDIPRSGQTHPKPRRRP